MRSDHRTWETFQHETESSGSDIKAAWLDPDTVRVWNPEIIIVEVSVCDEMFTASLIRFETVGKAAESGNRHGLFYRRNNPSVNAGSGLPANSASVENLDHETRNAGNLCQIWIEFVLS
jgi:hypothetical protein